MALHTSLHDIKSSYFKSYIKLWGFLFLVLLVPAIIVGCYYDINFDPAEFVNLYLSTIFTSVFIVFTLQILEAFRNNEQGKKRLKNHLQLMQKRLQVLKKEVCDKQDILKNQVQILLHSRKELLEFLIFDDKLNEELLMINSLSEFDYISLVLQNPKSITKNELLTIQERSDTIVNKITLITKNL